MSIPEVQMIFYWVIWVYLSLSFNPFERSYLQYCNITIVQENK